MLQSPKYRPILYVKLQYFNLHSCDGGLWRPACYSSEIWGYKYVFSKSGGVLLKALRSYIGVHRFAPIIGILGDFGQMPLQYLRWLAILKYWND